MLDAQRVSLELITRLRPLVGRIAVHDRDLADQVRRASSSVALNLAEGLASTKGNSRARFSTARGSASETLAALEVAIGWGYLMRPDVAESVAMLDRLGAMLYRL